ncbi:MAG: hypothetical protein WC365_06645 [Candidatus Babeliales bacterium]|jgi:hypothetical protein
MHTEVSVLEILFRISIFSLLAYNLYSLIKKYLLPMLADSVALERKEQTELLGKDKLLLATQNRVKGQIYNQKQMFTLLERNVQVWHDVQTEEQKLYEQKYETIVEHIAAKRQIQNQNIARAHTLQATFPPALAMATQELKNRYADGAGKELLTKIVSRIEIKGS